jgi:hypothetical protein
LRRGGFTCIADLHPPSRRLIPLRRTASLKMASRESRLVPNDEGPKRGLKRGRTLSLSCANALEVQVKSQWPDTSQNCSPQGRLAIAADLPI